MGDVLVTGATGGIGTALVSALLDAGHRVTAVGRNIERLNVPGRGGSDTQASARLDTRDTGRPDIQASGRLDVRGPGRSHTQDAGWRTVRGIEADLSKPETLAATIGALRESGELAHVDALIHCAGISPVAAVADTTPDMWRQILAVNVASAAELVRLTLPSLRRTRGHVIFVNASPGMTGVARWSAFVGSKAALSELADSLRMEEAANGIRVTTVYPAATATDLLGEVRRAFGRPYDPETRIRPETLAKMIVWALDAPPDAYPSELSVIPSPR